MNRSGDEKLPLPIDDERPVVVRHVRRETGREQRKQDDSHNGHRSRERELHFLSLFSWVYDVELAREGAVYKQRLM